MFAAPRFRLIVACFVDDLLVLQNRFYARPSGREFFSLSSKSDFNSMIFLQGLSSNLYQRISKRCRHWLVRRAPTRAAHWFDHLLPLIFSYAKRIGEKISFSAAGIWNQWEFFRSITKGVPFLFSPSLFPESPRSPYPAARITCSWWCRRTSCPWYKKFLLPLL